MFRSYPTIMLNYLHLNVDTLDEDEIEIDRTHMEWQTFQEKDRFGWEYHVYI